MPLNIIQHHLKPLLILIGLMIVYHASGQQQKGLDSILYTLEQLTGIKEKDSILLRRNGPILQAFKPQYLADPRYEKAMSKLKSTLKPDEYYSIAYLLFSLANYSSTTGEYNYPLDYGLDFIEELKSFKSTRQRFILLKAMRDLRVPYRNSSHIFEGLETYSNLASYFQQRGDSSGVSIAYNVLASLYNTLGLADKAEYFQLKSIDFLDDKIYPADTTYLGYESTPNIGLPGKINRKSVLGSYMVTDHEYTKALRQLHEALYLNQQLIDGEDYSEPDFIYLQIAKAQVRMGTDSAAYYFDLMRKALGDTIKISIRFAHYFQEKSYSFYMKNQLDSAEANILKCIELITAGHLPLSNIMGPLTPSYYLALIRVRQNRPKEAISALQTEISQLRALNLRRESLADLKLLADAYAVDDQYQNATKAYNDYTSLLNEMIADERNNRSVSFEIEKRMAENERAVELLETQNKYNQKRQYYLIGILGLLSILALGLLNRNRFRQKVNRKLLLKNKEIEATLSKLQSTQAQLIQSEKMASLGELTAGIAHEIQNPLNFINNFAEVNTELIDEMHEGIQSGNLSEVISTATQIRDNEEKIIFHGKRADAIVKSMLQHSRSSTGQRELTDINALTDEYLRLAYHGMRAKDKSFNVTIKTDFDESIGNIDIVPQDIGRVLLNLITNAFHALSAPLPPKGGVPHAPTVVVTTKRMAPPIGGKGGETIQISVSDNGPGIPDHIMEKIFQPFFTTKPTGQGTGLGLSLSYDIIKAHGGKLLVESEEGKGSTFIINLPTH